MSQKHRTACSQTPGPGLVLPRPRPHHSLDPLGPLLCRPDSHPFPASHAQQQGWEPRTAGRRGRSKGIAAAFLRAQPLFQTEQNKKGISGPPSPPARLLGEMQRGVGGRLAEVGGAATGSAGSAVSASLTRSSAGSPSRAREEDGNGFPAPSAGRLLPLTDQGLHHFPGIWPPGEGRPGFQKRNFPSVP